MSIQGQPYCKICGKPTMQYRYYGLGERCEDCYALGDSASTIKPTQWHSVVGARRKPNTTSTQEEFKEYWDAIFIPAHSDC